PGISIPYVPQQGLCPVTVRVPRGTAPGLVDPSQRLVWVGQPRAHGPGPTKLTLGWVQCSAAGAVCAWAGPPPRANAAVSDARNFPPSESHRKNVMCTAVGSIVTKLKLGGRPPRVRRHSVLAVETTTRPSRRSASSW